MEMINNKIKIFKKIAGSLFLKEYKWSALCGLLILLVTAGCRKDFLDRPPIDSITSGDFFKNDDEVMAATGPLYNIVWFDYNDKAFLAFGEAKGGNLQSNDRTPFIRFNPSSTLEEITTGYKSFYKIISQSNTTINNIQLNVSGDVSEKIRNEAMGECHFFQGVSYYYLVSNYGAVPIIFDNQKQLGGELHRNNIEDVWKYLIHELTLAVKLLPETPYKEGRLTKWSAKAMLAKMYLTYAGLGQNGSRMQQYLDSAKTLAGDVIHNSGMELFPNYPGLFTSANNNSAHNNPESLFSLQWMPSADPWGINNSFQAYIAYSPDITQTGDGWGAAQGISADAVKLFLSHPDDSVRRKATAMFDGDYYPELLQGEGGLHYDVTDISNIKKYIIGSPEENGGNGVMMGEYINTYMLRLAEVYLIYAEAILGNDASTSDPEALAYFNKVRERAGVSTKSSITFEDIFTERRLEFMMEGVGWYDILRWYYYDPQGAMDYVANQDKGTYTIEYIEGSQNPRRYNVTYESEYYPFTPQTVYLPFPEVEMINAPSLSEDPVPFDFSQIPDFNE